MEAIKDLIKKNSKLKSYLKYLDISQNNKIDEDGMQILGKYLK